MEGIEWEFYEESDDGTDYDDSPDNLARKGFSVQTVT